MAKVRFEGSFAGVANGVAVYDPPSYERRLRGARGPVPIFLMGHVNRAVADAFSQLLLAPMPGDAMVALRQVDRFEFELSVRVFVYDRDTFEQTPITFARKSSVDSFLLSSGGRQRAAEQMYKRVLLDFFEHEINECIRTKDGGRPFDPHKGEMP